MHEALFEFYIVLASLIRGQKFKQIKQIKKKRPSLLSIFPGLEPWYDSYDNYYYVFKDYALLSSPDTKISFCCKIEN